MILIGISRVLLFLLTLLISIYKMIVMPWFRSMQAVGLILFYSIDLQPFIHTFTH